MTSREDRRPRRHDAVRLALSCVGSAPVALVASGIYAYILQWRQGLVITGLRDQVSWGLYISNFVFWVGVSKGGTMISAIFRLTGAEWRRPYHTDGGGDHSARA